MLEGLHFLLTYKCFSECDHCFVYGGPQAEGTFTLAQVRAALEEGKRIGSVRRVFFEGGEPFAFYALLRACVRAARERGFEVGIVTNGYFATSLEDARLTLEPLLEAGLTDLTVSDDELHRGADAVGESPAQRALAAAATLGLAADISCTILPTVGGRLPQDGPAEEAEPAGEVRFRGRAAEKLVHNLPRRPWRSFSECPYEDLANPGRVHLDAYGNVHLCQGLLLGNMWEVPLSELVARYDPDRHPIVADLVHGGPARLAEKHNLGLEAGYVDACHLCYTARKALLDRFPQYLGPRQIYGLT